MLNKETRLLGLAFALGIGCLSNLPAADSSSTPEVTPEMQTLMNRTVVGKEAVSTEGEALFREGSSLLYAGKFEQARDAFIKAQRLFEQFNSEEFRGRVLRCQQMIKQCYIGKAKEAMRIAEDRAQARDFEDAIKICEEAIKYCPEERVALEGKITLFRTRQNAARIREESSIDRLQPNHARDLYDIQVLLQQGRELRDKGEFTKALRKFQEVTLIDPYNLEAAQNMIAVNTTIGEIGQARFSPTRIKMNQEVDWKYVIPVTANSDGLPGDNLLIDGPVVQPEKEESALQKKLDSIIIPKIDFEDVTVASAVRNLRDQSRLHDPERLGVNIFLRQSNNALLIERSQSVDGQMGGMGGQPGFDMPPQDADMQPAVERRITMSASNRSLMQVIATLCNESKMRYRVETYAVVLAPEGVAMDDMETRIFPVEQSALSSIPGGGEDGNALRDFFIMNGDDVNFPIGSKIVYDTRISRLIVTNTAENLRRIGEVINEMLDQQEPMVQVMLKFIEISQTNLRELAFNYQVAINDRDGVDRSGRTVVMPANSNELLRYYRDTSGGSATARNPVQESTFSYIWENSDGTRISGSMFALNWADSADVLASPRVTTLPEQTAHIEMVIERFFPEDWETIDLKSSDSSSDDSVMSSSWRTVRADPQPNFESDPRKLGIVFDITPRVDRERRTITAPISFPIQTFSGWMMFDARSIDSEGDDDGEYFKMPIFDRREINTEITVYDGDTIVLGGVTSDVTDTIHDKIPVLGDLPLVGRLFQSRYSHAEKHNLLVFLTCKLVKPDGTPFFPQEERERGVPHFGQNYF